ncbi:hypothetical protein Trydic_g3580 [Trypoxylus dichotomus]
MPTVRVNDWIKTLLCQYITTLQEPRLPPESSFVALKRRIIYGSIPYDNNGQKSEGVTGVRGKQIESLLRDKGSLSITPHMLLHAPCARYDMQLPLGGNFFSYDQVRWRSAQKNTSPR